MSGLNVVVDLESLEVSQSGKVTGRIRVSEGDVSFPDARWSDFVVVVLGWWSDAVLNLRSGRAREAHLRFMDGPFGIHIRLKHDEDMIEAEFLHSGARCSPGLVTATLIHLQGQVLTAGHRVLSYCDTNAVVGSDVANLRQRLSQLEALA